MHTNDAPQRARVVRVLQKQEQLGENGHSTAKREGKQLVAIVYTHMVTVHIRFARMAPAVQPPPMPLVLPDSLRCFPGMRATGNCPVQPDRHMATDKKAARAGNSAENTKRQLGSQLLPALREHSFSVHVYVSPRPHDDYGMYWLPCGASSCFCEAKSHAPLLST